MPTVRLPDELRDRLREVIVESAVVGDGHSSPQLGKRDRRRAVVDVDVVVESARPPRDPNDFDDALPEATASSARSTGSTQRLWSDEQLRRCRCGSVFGFGHVTIISNNYMWI
jgi:hypothetical protein